MFAASVITLFPEAFPGTLGVSLIGKALREGLWSLDAVDLRDFGHGPHRNVDDTPAGGGAGMVLRADVAAAAIDSISRNDRPLIYLSPRGAQFNQAMARDWASGPGLVLFCGRFEGLDERVIEGRDMQEVAVGEAVLAGGEAAALVLLEACVRLIPGVLGNDCSVVEESFSDGLLEHPQYTRPRDWEGRAIPDVLNSGDHAKIAAWRKAQREKDHQGSEVVVSVNFYAWRPTLGLDPEAKSFADDVDALYQKTEEPHPTVIAFIEALLSRYPDNNANPVWAAGPLKDEVLGGFVNVAVTWRRADEVWSFFVETGRAHGLVCFDPQSGRVHRP